MKDITFQHKGSGIKITFSSNVPKRTDLSPAELKKHEEESEMMESKTSFHCPTCMFHKPIRDRELTMALDCATINPEVKKSLYEYLCIQCATNIKGGAYNWYTWIQKLIRSGLRNCSEGRKNMIKDAHDMGYKVVEEN
ncbi:MAG: hypothetical protein OXB96_00350 [Candidatus Kaiserbacteria bacterium]|nr:hypothetical protein [Candidatus Kaiserbacteria bacterium]